MASNVISRRDLDLTVEDLLVPILLACESRFISARGESDPVFPVVIFVLSVLVAGATWYCCRWIWGSGGTPCRDELPLRNVRSWDLHPLSSNPPSTEDNTTVDATITIISPPPNALLHWPLKCQSSGHPFDAEKGVMCPGNAL